MLSDKVMDDSKPSSKSSADEAAMMVFMTETKGVLTRPITMGQNEDGMMVINKIPIPDRLEYEAIRPKHCIPVQNNICDDDSYKMMSFGKDSDLSCYTEDNDNASDEVSDDDWSMTGELCGNGKNKHIIS